MKKYLLLFVLVSGFSFAQETQKEYAKLSKEELIAKINSKDKEIKSLKEKLESEKTAKEKVIAEGLSIGAETTDENQKAVREFLSITKRFTIQGFMMSQYIMTEIKPYSLIPGSYNGEVLISSISNMKIDG